MVQIMPIYYSASRYGCIASQSNVATYVGIKVLENGGNAFDVALAVSSVLTIMLPHTSSIGGDGFLLAITDNDEIIAYNGSGYTPRRFPVADYLREKPLYGPLTITIPGLVDLWNWLWENYCSMNTSYLLGFALKLALNGFDMHEQLYEAIIGARDKYKWSHSWMNTFGKMDKYSFVKFPKLARILKELINKGFREFYEGDVGERVIEGLVNNGVKIDFNDFYTYQGKAVKPLKTSYNDFELYELPPNTQGITTLELLKLIEYENLNSRAFNDPERIISFFKLAEKAYIDRDNYLGDPLFMEIDPMELLRPREKNKQDMQSRRAKIKDTTFFTIADNRGNTVGFIQSIFYPFGSGIVIEDIPFHNRGAGFAKRAGLPNSPGHRKKPLHTLSILLARHDKLGDYVIGCAGGDLRPQIHAEVFTNIADYNMSLSKAVDAPRYMLLEWGDKRRAIVERDLLVKGLGENWVEIVAPKSGETGVAQALRRRRDGVVEAVADYRGGSVALPLYYIQ